MQMYCRYEQLVQFCRYQSFSQKYLHLPKGFHILGKNMTTVNESLYDTNSPSINLDEFRVMVAENAYYRAEARGFEQGYEWEDWHEAECEIRTERRYWAKEVT